MRKLFIGLVLGTLMAVALPASAKTSKLNLVIDNFRYCAATPCTPLDQGYVRNDAGPVSGTDNPAATIDVKRGTTVVWTYKDSFCDALGGCPGHNVYFENGKPSGVKKGFIPAHKGAKSITVKITQKPGTTIRYFCTVNGHYMVGMTGILHVT